MSDALVVVDMQRLFVDAVADEGPRVVEAVNDRVDRTLRDGGTVVYTRDVQPDDAPPDAPANELHPDLLVRGEVVAKGPGREGRYSGFLLDRTGAGGGGLSDLAARIVEAAPTRVVVVGLAADVCVGATAVDAVRLGYPTLMPLAATAFVHAHPDGDQAAVEALLAAGVDVG